MAISHLAKRLLLLALAACAVGQLKGPSIESYLRKELLLAKSESRIAGVPLDWSDLQAFFNSSEIQLCEIEVPENETHVYIRLKLRNSPEMWVNLEGKSGVSGRKLGIPKRAEEWSGVLPVLEAGRTKVILRRIDVRGEPFSISSVEIRGLDTKYYFHRDLIDGFKWVVWMGLLFVAAIPWMRRLACFFYLQEPFFKCYPRTTLGFFSLALIFSADLLAGLFIIPKLAGRRDYYYHHGLRANCSVGVQGAGGNHVFKTNALEMRDRTNRQVLLVPEKKRITFFGDSFVQDSAVPYDESMVGIVARDYAEQGVEVLNAGVQSFSPKLYFLRANDLLVRRGFRTNEIWVFIDISDIQDEVNYWWFESENPTLKMRTEDAVMDWLSSHSASLFLWKKISAYQRPENIVKRPMSTRETGGTEVRADAGNKKSDTLPRGYQESMEQWIHGEALWEGGRSYYEERDRWTIDDKIYQRWGKAGVVLGYRNMEKMQRLCQKYGVTLGVAVYPHIAQIESGDISSLQVKVWEEFCRTHGIPFIDLFPPFFEGKSAKESIRLYFNEDDRHWSPRGCKLIAENWMSARKKMKLQLDFQ